MRPFGTQGMLAGWCRNVDSLTGEKDRRRRSGCNGSKEGHDRDKREGEGTPRGGEARLIEIEWSGSCERDGGVRFGARGDRLGMGSSDAHFN